MNRPLALPLIAVIAPLLFTSCENSLEDDKRYAEEKSIESYISSNNWTFTKSDGVYHITSASPYGYEVNHGDTVEFWFKGYTPETTPLVFETNIKAEAISAKLDTNIRSFKPLRVIAGETNLVEGLKRGLLLSRQNQACTIIFPSSLGFKGEYMGPIEAWSSLAYDIDIIYLNGPGIQTENQKLSGIDLSTYTRHESGIYQKTIVETSTVKPESTATVYGWYKCSLPDGTPIEEISSANAEIDLTSATITTALRVGFTLVSRGGTSNFVAPSPLCYGKKGTKNVSPYQPLLYTIRLDSIKSNR
ncbi:MAG: FKBP-type peptidyl-prolyl cis-trans isomerase [Bacteroidales bacterium]|nr:FKBP-type peptidyl-prolyl cis-trans isomerase [Bacteroidales bacterium]